MTDITIYRCPRCRRDSVYDAAERSPMCLYASCPLWMITMPHPYRQTQLPTDPKTRKEHPIARGVLDYFPLAIAEVARVSKVGNDQHNPGQPMHWAREKSSDHADCIARHLIERGSIDTDGLRHSAKMAWRALALLQLELEAAVKEPARA